MLRGMLYMIEVRCRLGWTRIRDRECGRQSGWLHLDDVHVGGDSSEYGLLFGTLQISIKVRSQVNVMHRDPRTRRACFGAVVGGGKLDDIVLKKRAATRNLVIVVLQPQL